MQPLSIVVIDKPAQLTEYESTISLQRPGVKHVVLADGVCQLPAMVINNGYAEAGFARILFERSSLLDRSKYPLNMQYRMEPSRILIPDSNFYHNLIPDVPNVKQRCHEKHYLSRAMFGPFINVIGGREEKDEDGHGWKNMEEAIVSKILQNLYEGWAEWKQRLSIGIASLEDIPEFINGVGSVFNRYSDDFINLCKKKCLDCDLVLPKSWPSSSQYAWFKDLNFGEAQRDFVGDSSTEAYVPEHFKGSWHGTTVLGVRISATELLIGVDSLMTTTYIEDDPDDPNNKRIYEILWSELVKKFLQITPEVYATLCGDGKRCDNMVTHVQDIMKARIVNGCH